MYEKGLAVYLHVPFCRSKCPYCDFLSFTGKEERHFRQYFEALEDEIIEKFRLYGNTPVSTVFFGGGTPTLVEPDYLVRAVKLIEKCSGGSFADYGTEITSEANPESVTYDKLRVLREAGFNRISIGVQSFSDTELKRINRAHNRESALKAFHNARRAGFENINIDIMFALPGQDIRSLIETLDTAVSLKPEHISFYSLTLEENAALLKYPDYVPADDETDREMYHTAIEKLCGAGYKHYEISNFALPDRECRHNLAYWTGVDYIGLGLGAHSLSQNQRYHNTECLEKYLERGFSKEYKEDIEVLDSAGRQSEFMILGLRLIDGVSEAEFYKLFGLEIDGVYGRQLSSLAASGLILRDWGIIRLTSKGIDLANQVFREFI